MRQTLFERIHNKYLSLTASQRCLPDFLVIGGQKCGTTSLYDYVVQHPQVLTASKKGVHYFDANYERGERWYRAHFPLRRQKQAGQITGEASPYYVAHPHVPTRIARLTPQVKLIVLLRNPVTRAISHYFHEFRKGKETFTLEQALASEDARLRPEWQQLCQDEAYQSVVFRTYSYKRRGLYYEQLARYGEYFARDQLFVIKSEDFFEQPLRVLSEVFGFLGVDPSFQPPDLSPKNIGDYSQKVSPDTLAALREYFAPHNQHLYAYLERDFGW